MITNNKIITMLSDSDLSLLIIYNTIHYTLTLMSKSNLTQFESSNQAMFEQLQLIPQSEEDEQQLIKILKFLLFYPSNDLADTHRMANRLGNFDELTSRQMLKKQYIAKVDNYNTCQCCYSIVQQSALKPFTRIQNVVTLGQATKLFFNDLKFGILMLVISFFLYGIYAFATNISASNRNQISCFSNKTCKLALIGLGSKLYTEHSDLNRRFYIAQNYIGLLMIILWAIVFVLKTFQQRKITMMMDKHAATASDFTVMFTNLPKFYTKQTLQAKLDEYADNMKEMIIEPLDSSTQYDGKFTISRFNPVKAYYQTLKMSQQIKTQAQKKLESASQQLRNIIRDRKNFKGFTIIKDQREQLYRKIDELRVEITGQRLRKLKIIEQTYRRKQAQETRIVFVTFNHSYAKINLLRLNEFSLLKKLKMRYKRKRDATSIDIDGVEIENAPQPEDVIWQHIGISKRQRYIRRFFTVLITILILGGSFGATFGLSKIQTNNNNVVISLLISIVISSVNVLLDSFIQILTVQQKHYTTSQYQISVGFKIVFSQLVNSILIGMMAAVYIKKNIYQQGGLVDDVFYFGLINMIFPPLIKIINPYYWSLRALRYYYSRPNQKLYFQSQIQFNKRWQGAEFQIGLEYVYVLKTIIYTAFFMALQPIIILFAIVGIFFMYQSQKVCLFYQSIRPKPSSNIITSSMNSLFYLSIIAYGLGSLTWTNFLPDAGAPRYTLAPNILCILIGVLLYFVTFGDLTDIMIEQKYASLVYEKQRLFLHTQYDRVNPTSRSEGIKSFIKYLQIKKKEYLANQNNKQIKQNMNYLSKMLFRSKYQSQLSKHSQPQPNKNQPNHNDDQKLQPHLHFPQPNIKQLFSQAGQSKQNHEQIFPIPKIKINRLKSMFEKRQQNNVQAALSRINSGKANHQGIETQNRLQVPGTNNVHFDSSQLKNIMAINSLQHKPSIISSRFNPIDFIQAVRSDKKDKQQDESQS